MAWMSVWMAGATVWCGAQEMGLLISTPNTVYLAGEPVVADVRIHNRTTRAFQVKRGVSPSYLGLMVTQGEARNLIEPFDPGAVPVEVTIPSSAVWEGQIEVSAFVPVREPGRYLLRLVVEHGGIRYESFPRSFDVVPGLELAKVAQVFPGDPPLRRQIRLAYWSRNQMEELFLQIADQPQIRVWRTYRLGPLLRITEPKMDMAPDGVLTVVHRATPDVFFKTQVRLEETAVTFLGQEKLLDPVASASRRMLPFQQMAMEDAIDKRDREKEKKRRGWWPF